MVIISVILTDCSASKTLVEEPCHDCILFKKTKSPSLKNAYTGGIRSLPYKKVTLHISDESSVHQFSDVNPNEAE